MRWHIPHRPHPYLEDLSIKAVVYPRNSFKFYIIIIKYKKLLSSLFRVCNKVTLNPRQVYRNITDPSYEWMGYGHEMYSTASGAVFEVFYGPLMIIPAMLNSIPLRFLKVNSKYVTETLEMMASRPSVPFI